MPSVQVPVLGSLFVSFRPSLIRSHSCSSGAYLMLSLSVFPLSFRFLSSASVPLPATQLSVSSVPLFLALPLSGFSSASVLPFGSPVFHLLFRLVSHASFPVFGTWLSVRFLSSFPVSLPQPFHRCLPSALTSGLFHFRLPSFRPFLFRFQLLSFLFLPFLSLPVSPSQRVFFGAAPPPFSFLAPPLPFRPVSRASLPFLRTQLSVRFLSSFPASLPQPFHWCFPFALAFGLSPLFHFLSSASARF